jgi:hypothetical protein
MTVSYVYGIVSVEHRPKTRQAALARDCNFLGAAERKCLSW